MKRRNRCMVIALVMVLLLTTVDTGICLKKADAATETVAYLEFVSKWWETYKYGTGNNSTVVADNAIVDGDGVYQISLDFSGNYQNCMHGITSCIVRIKDGEGMFGSSSHIQTRSIKITNIGGEEKTISNIGPGYTFADSEGQTSQYLYSASNVPYANNLRAISGELIMPEAKDYQLIDKALENENIQKIEVTFAFAKDVEALSQIPADATPRPHTTATPDVTATPKATAKVSPKPTATQTPDISKPTAAPQASVSPSATPDPTENIVSNSTYTGSEKILINRSSLVIAAGGQASATIALLRGADSVTQVTASSGNNSIAVPTLQPNGKLNIAVPSNAPAGSSTMITLHFGSSYAVVKVTVSNPIIQMKGAKKSYTIKRKKTVKVSVNLTPKNTANAMTDSVTASISKKSIASVNSVKVSKNKASIKVKALKKGTAKLKVKAGGKSASIKIKVK